MYLCIFTCVLPSCMFVYWALAPVKQATLWCSARWKQYSKEVAAIYQVPPPDQALHSVGKVLVRQALGQEFKSLEPK